MQRHPDVKPWLAFFLKYVMIGGDCFKTRGPLMVRYRLLATSRGNLYLHHFLRSDADRHCHDHPWDFTSLILWPGYYENTPQGRERKWPGMILRRAAEWQHWVEMLPGKKCWTVVWVSNKRRPWGFITEKGWVEWRQYEHEFPGACDE